MVDPVLFVSRVLHSAGIDRTVKFSRTAGSGWRSLATILVTPDRCRTDARRPSVLAVARHLLTCRSERPKAESGGRMALEIKSIDSLVGTPMSYSYAVKAGPWVFLTGHEAIDWGTGTIDASVSGPAVGFRPMASATRAAARRPPCCAGRRMCCASAGLTCRKRSG